MAELQEQKVNMVLERISAGIPEEIIGKPFSISGGITTGFLNFLTISGNSMKEPLKKFLADIPEVIPKILRKSQEIF